MTNLTEGESNMSDKWAKANLKGDKIKINDDGTVDYCGFLAGFPFCTDGYKEKIRDEIEKRGYNNGLGTLIYRDNISPSELIECMLFKSAYDYTYFNVIGEGPNARFKSLSITVSEFMKKIEENIGIMKKGKLFRLSWEDVYMDIN